MLYGKYFSIHLKSRMQYKTSFFLTAVSQFMTSFSVFLSIRFMFARFNRVDDFTYTEVLLCFAVVLMAFSLAECFVRGFDTFSVMISDGEFDRIMVRPRSPIFQVLASKIEFTRIGRLSQAIIVFAYAIPASGINWTFGKVITLLLMLVSGFAVFSGLFIIYASFCFFTIEGLEFMNIFTDGGREFGSYPLSIYGEGILKFFTYIIPTALFQYYPFLYLVGRSDNRLYMFLPLAGILFLIPCYCFWRFGLRHYKSTGS
jgi:ABC-2 type transport system permease protein